MGIRLNATDEKIRQQLHEELDKLLNTKGVRIRQVRRKSFIDNIDLWFDRLHKKSVKYHNTNGRVRGDENETD